MKTGGSFLQWRKYGPLMFRQSRQKPKDRSLDIEEIRLVSDLRIMHTKITELYQFIHNLRARHDEETIHTYSAQPALAEKIRKVDEIYLWFVKLKEKAER